MKTCIFKYSEWNKNYYFCPFKENVINLEHFHYFPSSWMALWDCILIFKLYTQNDIITIVYMVNICIYTNFYLLLFIFALCLSFLWNHGFLHCPSHAPTKKKIHLFLNVNPLLIYWVNWFFFFLFCVFLWGLAWKYSSHFYSWSLFFSECSILGKHIFFHHTYMKWFYASGFYLLFTKLKIRF